MGIVKNGVEYRFVFFLYHPGADLAGVLSIFREASEDSFRCKLASFDFEIPFCGLCSSDLKKLAVENPGELEYANFSCFLEDGSRFYGWYGILYTPRVFLDGNRYQ